jgi:tRNA-2-methylthio-N6-dimethylallyladenosine synthase
MTHLIPDIDIVDSAEKERDATCEVKITEDSGLPGRQLYIESYGCQMNFSDSEIVTAILQKD